MAKKSPAPTTTKSKSATEVAPAKATKTIKVSLPETPSTSAERSAERVAPKREITHEMIAERAYYLFIAGLPGSQDDHWQQAERELRG